MVNADSIPAELRARPQWLTWQYRDRRNGNGEIKRTKVPLVAGAKREAKSNDPATWGTFEAAAADTAADGVGFVFSAEDPYCGVDIDACRNGHGLHPDAAKLVERLDSYTEVSPSGAGVHVLLRGSVPGERHSKRQASWGDEFAVYDRGRFFCMTGNRLPDTPGEILPRQAQLQAVCESIWPSGKIWIPNLRATDDDALLRRARAAKNGGSFSALFSGDWSRYGSQSEGDMALVAMLAFWTGPDPERIDALFRKSALMRPKWNEGRGESTYGSATIAKALAGRTEFYDGGAAPPVPGEPDAVVEQLGELFDLPSVGVSIRGAALFGSGSRATAEITLSSGEVMTFDRLRDMANPTVLAAELVACSGATPKLTKPLALRAVALLRTLAAHHRTMTDNDAALDWGISYLQAADVHDVDMHDQAQRWHAFSGLAAIDPWVKAREQGLSVAAASLVLRDTDGTRLVRSSWFTSHARAQDGAVSQLDVGPRMSRVGWYRRGRQGRVKASRPGMPGALSWAFFFVPAGWEERA